MKTLKEIIESNFEGFPRGRMMFWYPDHLPNPDWSNDWSGQQCQRFSEGEKFEEIPLRTWICTDTIVGLYAILWNGELIAFRYKSGRKMDAIWTFTDPDMETAMWAKFMSYAEFRHKASCGVLDRGSEFYSLTLDETWDYDWETGLPCAKDSA
jgi:hypothetical protein